MRKELLKQLKEIYKNDNQIKIYDFNGWNVHIKSLSKNISIWIEDSNINCCMTDSRNDDDFYEFYIYEGLYDDLRKNKYVKKVCSNNRLDYQSAINVINNICF